MSGSALVSLVTASLLGGLAAASWGWLQTCFANFGDIVRHIIFRYAGQHYDFVEESFQSLQQRVAIANVLEQVDLVTYCSKWQHEASNEAENCIQHGFVLLPSRSWCQTLATQIHWWNYMHFMYHHW